MSAPLHFDLCALFYFPTSWLPPQPPASRCPPQLVFKSRVKRTSTLVEIPLGKRKQWWWRRRPWPQQQYQLAQLLQQILYSSSRLLLWLLRIVLCSTGLLAYSFQGRQVLAETNERTPFLPHLPASTHSRTHWPITCRRRNSPSFFRFPPSNTVVQVTEAWY